MAEFLIQLFPKGYVWKPASDDTTATDSKPASDDAAATDSKPASDDAVIVLSSDDEESDTSRPTDVIVLSSDDEDNVGTAEIQLFYML